MPICNAQYIEYWIKCKENTSITNIYFFFYQETPKIDKWNLFVAHSKFYSNFIFPMTSLLKMYTLLVKKNKTKTKTKQNKKHILLQSHFLPINFQEKRKRFSSFKKNNFFLERVSYHEIWTKKYFLIYCQLYLWI